MMVWDIAPVFPNNNGPNTFNAVIGIGGAAYGVTLDQDITIESFDLTSPDATLLYDGAHTLQINQNLTLDSAAVDGQALGGQIIVGGITTIGSGTYRGLGRILGNGVVNYAATGGVTEIDDTDVVHNDGQANVVGTQDIVLGDNARILNNASSTMTIANDRQIRWNSAGTRSSIVNAGTIVRDTGTGVADLSGVTLINTGSVETRTGTLRLDRLSLAGTTLSGGTYRIMGGNLDVVGQTIAGNAATVEFGAGAGTFAAFGGVTTNQSAGTIRVSGGRTFTTGGDLQNDGKIEVQAASTFAIPGGSALTNVSGGSITGGTFMVAGTLRAQNLSAITTVAATVVLDGAGSRVTDLSDVDALTSVATVASGGTLGVMGGRNFTTAGDLTLGGTGAVAVGSGSTFEVNGTITNFAGGVFTDGRLTVSGTLRFNDADISTVAADLSLNEPGAQIVNQSNQDAFQNLATVTSAGSLSISNGRDLSTTGTLANAGALNVGAPGGAATTLTVAGAFNQTSGATTLANGTINAAGGFNLMGGLLSGNGTINGSMVSHGSISPGASPGLLAVVGDVQQMLDGAINIQIGGLGRGVAVAGYDAVDISGALTFENQAAGELNVSLIDGFVPRLGDAFHIVSFGSHDGGFGGVTGLEISGILRFEVLYSVTEITLVVVPGPGVLGFACGVGLAACRRRRW